MWSDKDPKILRSLLALGWSQMLDSRQSEDRFFTEGESATLDVHPQQFFRWLRAKQLPAGNLQSSSQPFTFASFEFSILYDSVKTFTRLARRCCKRWSSCPLTFASQIPFQELRMVLQARSFSVQSFQPSMLKSDMTAISVCLMVPLFHHWEEVVKISRPHKPEKFCDRKRLQMQPKQRAKLFAWRF